MSAPTAPEGVFPDLVKTPVKTLGSSTKKKRGENPSGSAANDHRQRSRQVSEPQRERCSPKRARDGHRSWDGP